MAFVKPDKFHAMAIKSAMNIENKYPQKIDICAIDSLSSATRNRNRQQIKLWKTYLNYLQKSQYSVKFHLKKLILFREKRKRNFYKQFCFLEF